MKLNSLTNNLAGNDKSLSNSYLSHIVELLRTEVASLTEKESNLEQIVDDHIETQKEVVDTKLVNTDKINTSSINDKIILTNVIDVLTNLKVNGKKVLTLNDISEFANSEELKKLQSELVEVEKRYYEMLPRYAKDNADGDFYNHFRDFNARYWIDTRNTAIVFTLN